MPSLHILPVLLVINNISGYIDGALVLSILEYIKDLIISLIEVIAGSLVLIFLFRLLVLISTKSEEVIILPFEVSTSKKTYNGNIISDSLLVELRKIKEIHDHKFEGKDVIGESIYLPRLAPHTENFETKFSNLGNVNIAGMTLSMGSILTVLKRLWSLGGQIRTIKGSLQEYDSETHLIALMEVPRVYGWDIGLKIEQSTKEDIIPELIKDLAFMITYDLSMEELKEKEEPKEKKELKEKEEIKGKKEITAKTWMSLKYFTEALDFYSQYIATKKPEHLENALKNCIKASEEEKDYLILFNLFYNLGLSYYDIKDYHSAEDAFRRCITLIPNNEKGLIGLGITLDNLGRYEEALKAYNKALETDHKLAYTWYNKGVTLNNLGQHEEALNAYNKIIEIDPKSVYAWNNKGVTLSSLGRYKEALKVLDKALEIDPTLAYPWYNKGVALFKIGQYETALEAFENALEINPKVADAWYNRACAYSRMSRKNEALADLKHAVELNPFYR